VLGGYQKHEQTPRGYQGGFRTSLYPFFHENRWFFEVLETTGTGGSSLILIFSQKNNKKQELMVNSLILKSNETNPN